MNKVGQNVTFRDPSPRIQYTAFYPELFNICNTLMYCIDLWFVMLRFCVVKLTWKVVLNGIIPDITKKDVYFLDFNTHAIDLLEFMLDMSNSPRHAELLIKHFRVINSVSFLCAFQICNFKKSPTVVIFDR